MTIDSYHEDDGYAVDDVTMAGNEQRCIGERAGTNHHHALIPVVVVIAMPGTPMLAIPATCFTTRVRGVKVAFEALV